LYPHSEGIAVILNGKNGLFYVNSYSAFAIMFFLGLPAAASCKADVLVSPRQEQEQ